MDWGSQNGVLTNSVFRDNSQAAAHTYSNVAARYANSTYNASGSLLRGIRAFDTLGGSGPDLYCYLEQSSSLSNIQLDSNNAFGFCYGGSSTNIASASTVAPIWPVGNSTVVETALAQTLTYKTFTSSTNSWGGVTAAFGSDAKGDIYTNGGSSNVLTRLGIGSSGQCLTVSSSLPAWATCVVAVGNITGLGTGVATALGVNIGTAGSPVVNGGALGTPSSGNLANATGLPIAGVTGYVAPTSWTPVLNFGGTACTAAGTPCVYSRQLGTYVKVGQMVVAQWRITLTTLGTGSGYATLSGFPGGGSSSGSTFGAATCVYVGGITYGGHLGGYLDNTGTLSFTNDNGGTTTLSNTAFSSSTDMVCSVSYPSGS